MMYTKSVKIHSKKKRDEFITLEASKDEIKALYGPERTGGLLKVLKDVCFGPVIEEEDAEDEEPNE